MRQAPPFKQRPNLPASAIIVYGARCTWWDSIDKTANTGPERQGIPCCPHCGGVLFQKDNEAAFMKGVPAYEANGHPGYAKMLTWSRGKCFPTMDAVKAAYKADTGIIVP